VRDRVIVKLDGRVATKAINARTISTNARAAFLSMFVLRDQELATNFTDGLSFPLLAVAAIITRVINFLLPARRSTAC
jgi:hypothetical protein